MAALAVSQVFQVSEVLVHRVLHRVSRVRLHRVRVLRDSRLLRPSRVRLLRVVSKVSQAVSRASAVLVHRDRVRLLR